MKKQKQKQRKITLDEVLAAARYRVSRWPEWMQRPEYRQRPPYKNAGPR